MSQIRKIIFTRLKLWVAVEFASRYHDPQLQVGENYSYFQIFF